MRHGYGRNLGRGAAILGLLAALTLSAGARPARAATETKAAALVADWPATSRLMALAMIAQHGEPSRKNGDALTWFDLYGGRRTVVHREENGRPMIEQVVHYRVPEDKTADLAAFDDRITVDKDAAELSVLTDDERTNFLVLNLAHEIASGFKTVPEAKEFYRTQMELAGAGKSSPYRESILFEHPQAFAAPRDGRMPRQDLQQ